MKKRLRKKKHLGEFQELGFEVDYRESPSLAADEQEALLWRFIEGAIERNGLAAGGGGGGDAKSFFVIAGSGRGSATEEQRAAVAMWLQAEPQVLHSRVGPLRDAWYGWDQ